MKVTATFNCKLDEMFMKRGMIWIDGMSPLYGLKHQQSFTLCKTNKCYSRSEVTKLFSALSLVFICRENPRRSGISLFPDRPRFSRLMKTENRRYPRLSGMNGDKSEESGAFLFFRRVPDFFDGRRSFPTNENSNFDRRGRRDPSAMDFARYQTPKLLGSRISQINRVMAISNLLPKRQRRVIQHLWIS